MPEGVAGGAVDLGDAPQGVGVLHLFAVLMALQDPAPLQQCMEVVRHLGLPGVRPQRVDPGVEGDIRPAQRFGGTGRRDVGGAA